MNHSEPDGTPALGRPEPGDITRILAEGGDGRGLRAIAPLVYNELRGIASRALHGEAAGHTLETHDLVHEVFLKLSKADISEVGNRVHFFALAARVTRQILVDHAKRRGTAKRGGGQQAVPLESVSAAGSLSLDASTASDLVDLDRALDRLAALSERQAKVVECRFFGAMSVDETAEALGISHATVKRDWSTARAWLNHVMTETVKTRPS